MVRLCWRLKHWSWTECWQVFLERALVGSGKDLPDGRTAQRLIMDLRATNSILQVIAGDIKGLSGAAAFTTISLEKGQVISISGDDLVSSFYLFRLPEVWLPYMAFERPIDWRSLGVDRDGSTILAACVLPMGFTSSVGIMQHIHRRLALEPGSRCRVKWTGTMHTHWIFMALASLGRPPFFAWGEEG